jgi:hypothetical protein
MRGALVMAARRVTKATLRAYHVGFGDCLLLRLNYGNDQRNVLIDFGSTQRPRSAPETRMADIVGDIQRVTGSKLHVVVATHRHADHISGFGKATGPAIAAMHPELVIQPWTEEPGLDPHAMQPMAAAPAEHLALAATMTNMHTFAAGARAEGERLGDTRRFPDFPSSLAERLEFLGATNVRNPDAVDLLARMGAATRYVKFGDDLSDESLLPNVRIDVLGPPTLADAPAIAHQAQKNAAEFWLRAGQWGLAAANGDAVVDDLADPPLFTTTGIPKAAEWLVPRIDRARADGALSLLRTMDGVLNNTSVILLIEINGVTLLFPGDAQIENWSYALFDAPNSAEIKERLAATRLYKVGHHGSLNATPQSLWKLFRHRNADEDAPDRLISVVSTLTGKHGSSSAHTEVPRSTLVSELLAQSNYVTTQTPAPKDSFWVDVEIPLR